MCLYFTWNFHKCNLNVAYKTLKKKGDKSDRQAAAAMEIITSGTTGWAEDAKRKFKAIARTLFDDEDEPDELAVEPENNSMAEDSLDSGIEKEQRNRLGSKFELSVSITEPHTRNPLINELQKEMKKYQEMDIQKWKE